MDLIFNELSFLHKAQNEHGARELMVRLLRCCKAAQNAGGCDHLRLRRDFFEQDLAEGYLVRDWLSDQSVSRVHKDLLLGIKRFPYIDEQNEELENCFLEHTYRLTGTGDALFHDLEVEGLAVAFFSDCLAASLGTHDYWDNEVIDLLEDNGGSSSQVQVRHISRPDHVEGHRHWLGSRSVLVLVESDLAAEDKEVSLRDDHGKDVLTAFCRKLVRSPYVLGIINSLPFNPHQRRPIRKVFPDGRIEFILTWTEQGLGCVIQTTGRNLHETRKIAEMLQQRYGA